MHLLLRWPLREGILNTEAIVAVMMDDRVAVDVHRDVQVERATAESPVFRKVLLRTRHLRVFALLLKEERPPVVMVQFLASLLNDFVQGQKGG